MLTRLRSVRTRELLGPQDLHRVGNAVLWLARRVRNGAERKARGRREGRDGAVEARAHARQDNTRLPLEAFKQATRSTLLREDEVASTSEAHPPCLHQPWG